MVSTPNLAASYAYVWHTVTGQVEQALAASAQVPPPGDYRTAVPPRLLREEAEGGPAPESTASAALEALSHELLDAGEQSEFTGEPLIAGKVL